MSRTHNWKRQIKQKEYLRWMCEEGKRDTDEIAKIILGKTCMQHDT